MEENESDDMLKICEKQFYILPKNIAMSSIARDQILSAWKVLEAEMFLTPLSSSQLTITIGFGALLTCVGYLMGTSAMS